MYADGSSRSLRQPVSFCFSDKNMRKILLILCILSLILGKPFNGFGQALPNLGAATTFVLFSGVGAVSNTGNSQYTGDIGSSSGALLGFGNIDGQMHAGDATSTQCATDLNNAITQINALTCDSMPLVLTASNRSFHAGTYCVALAATLSDTIVLDAQQNSNAMFVFRITGSLTALPNTYIVLKNGAQACRVFWQVGGLASIGMGSQFKGNIIGSGLNTVTIGPDVNLEGRVLTTAGAITVNASTARVPLGCGLPVLTGPVSPNMRSANCYALFSSSGSLSNTGTTIISGRIGTDNGTVTGFTAGNVSQGIFINDANTHQCKTDIETAYQYINGLAPDIDITFPAALGSGFRVSPHVYRLNANTILTDTLFIDAQGNSNAVFVLKVNGSFTASAGSQVTLINGAKSCNVFWQVTGTVDINANAGFTGTLISDNTITTATGVHADGRLLTRSGAVSTNTLNAAIPTGCGGCPYSPVNNQPHAMNDSIMIPEDAPLYTIAVQANDNDPDLDPLTTAILVASKHGVASLNGNAINYKTNADFNGKDTIVYTVCDNGTPSLCDTAFVFITVFPVNDRPVAGDDSAVTPRNTPVTIAVKNNDSDVDGDTLTLSIVSQPDSGTAVLAGNNITYTPNPNFSGRDTFYYRVCDNGAPSLCDTAMVIVRVTLNRPPVAVNDTLGNCAQLVTTLLVQQNDNDPDGDVITMSIVTPPAHGTATVNDTVITYTSQAGYTGNDTIRYRICDADFCDSAFVFIKVNPNPVADAGADRELNMGESVRIGADPKAGESYRWMPAAGLSADNISNPVASPQATTTYQLRTTITATGCADSGSVTITVIDEGFYNGLSPNNDGKNDYWKIPVLNRYPDNTVTVINRFGDEVWKASGYDNNQVKFTGQNMNGKDLPDGTYFYVISYNGTEKQGWVIIKR